MQSNKSYKSAVQTNYKQTEIGLIPTDWVVKKLGEFGIVFTGNTPNTNDRENYGTEYKFVSPFDLGEGKYIIKTEKNLSKKGFDSSRKFPKGTILFCCIGSTIGKSGIANDCLTSNQQINAVVVSENYSNEFLYYELEFNVGKIKLMAGEQAVPIINKSQFCEIKLKCPPLHEQQKIATILSTWDKAIDTTKQIIENLQARNKGLAQQLLTGKKRVKGFEKTKWKRLNADEVFVSISQKNNGIDEVLLSATQDRGMIPRDMLEGRVTMPTGETNSYKLVDKGDFVISLRSFQGGLEYSEYRGLVSPAYTVLKPIVPINDAFYKFYFKSYDFIGHLSVAVIGIRDGKNISYENFSTIIIPCPPIEEQKNIANILNNANAELQQYQQVLAQYQQQKKGLMQQLLSGKVRVNVV